MGWFRFRIPKLDVPFSTTATACRALTIRRRMRHVAVA